MTSFVPTPDLQVNSLDESPACMYGIAACTVVARVITQHHPGCKSPVAVNFYLFERKGNDMKEAHVLALKKLSHREFYHIDTGEGSGAAIYKIKDKFILFEIPMYGGQERYVDIFGNVDDLVKCIDSLS